MPGTVISNTAEASFRYAANVVKTSSNTVNVTSTIIKTPSSITLYQYATSGSSVSLAAPTQHATSGPPASGFVVSANPQITRVGGGVTTLNPTTLLPLKKASAYSTGEPVFIQVNDADQNLDPTKKETVKVTVTSSTGDREVLRLTETGINTGIFIAYIQSTAKPVVAYDGLLTLGENTRLTVKYVDQYDPSDVSISGSTVDPFGHVFSSLNGKLEDGAVVTLLDSNNKPAKVFGDDGISTYSNPVVTGSTVTDSSGTIYNFPSGGYRFPRIASGTYKLVVTPPPGFVAPSRVSETDLQKLPGAPYELKSNASFAQAFTIVSGPPLHVDIPLDPASSSLVIEKTVSKDSAAIGDFVQYTLTLDNVDANTVSNRITVTDTLPVGFRYQTGSVRYDGLTGNDPIVSTDGRTLKFSISSLAPGVSTQIRYVTEITVASKLGKAVNSVYAEDSQLIRSNTALAALTVTEDLFSSHGFIAGRVIVGGCGDKATTGQGLPSARLFMEDGTYAATDENGRYHFEGITPGTHVVQLDKASIPDNMEVVDCVRNTRFAGTSYSQFVDVKGGSLWRVDFYVRKKPPLAGTASLYVHSKLNKQNIEYTIEMSNGKVAVNHYRLVMNLPQGINYVMGSSMMNNVVMADPAVKGNILIYSLGDLGVNWKRKLTLRAHIQHKAEGKLVTSAFILLDTKMKKSIRSRVVKNSLHISRKRIEEKSITYRAFFEPMGAELSASTKQGIRRAIGRLGDVKIEKNEITGYADTMQINSRSHWLYKDNMALSLARAKVVGNYLINRLNIDKKKVIVRAEGAKNPLADNHSIKGRSRNRRAELVVSASKIVAPRKVQLVQPKSKIGKVKLKANPVFKTEKLIRIQVVPKQLDVGKFDKAWLKTEKPGYQWLMPEKGFSPAQPTVNIAIKHKPADNFELRLNGKPVSPFFYFGVINNRQGTVARSYWQGLHLVNGNNRFEFIVKDNNGKVIKRMQRNIIFSGAPVRAVLDKKYSRLIADGRHPPVVAIRVYDKNGYPARPGSRGKFTIKPPFLARQEVEAFQRNRLSGLNQHDPEYLVGENGLAYIVLEPTTKTGKVEVDLPFAGRKQSRIQTWLHTEIRNWIMVGLAQGTVGYNRVAGNQQSLTSADISDAFYRGGKVAFYAKGKVKGKWLLTTAYNSAKQTGAGDNRLNQLIDPNTYYTIYGDNSRQRYDASSADKLYIKIERDQFYALYGDMDTGLTVTDLSKFSRRMTGFKSEGDFKHISYTAFAAENRNKFIKDEIQGQGISGLYHLTGKNIVINSDDIVIETRDRFRSEKIISRKTLKRYLDYSIDYQDGTVYFRRPIPSKDENFNPVFIVVNYEVESPMTGKITAGGRVATKLNNGKVEIGGTIVHDGTYRANGNLYGADARIEVDKQTEVRLEAATTDVDKNGSKVKGNAYSVQVVHGGNRFKTRAYATQQGTDFGLGQQSISQTGTRKLGIEGDYRLDNNTSVDATVYHEDNLVSSAKRNVAETNVRYGTHSYALSAGTRMAHDQDSSGVMRNSNLLVLGGSKNLLGNRMKIRGAAEIAVGGKNGGANNANPDYPSRYTLGTDYFITPKVNLFVENEWTNGNAQNTQMMRAGVRSTPWSGAQITTAVNQETNENGLRSFATMGLTQSFPINKRWSGDVTFDQAKTLRHPGAKPFYANVPIAQGTNNNDFTAISLGTTYHAENYTFNNRVEVRNAQSENKVGLLANWERNLMQGIGYSASLRLFNTSRNDGGGLLDGDVRFSLAYRPLQSAWIIFNRLDYKFNSRTDFIGLKTRQRKLIENLASNYLLDKRNQFAFNLGIKYGLDNFDSAQYGGVTYLLGGEYIHDLNDIFDVGVHANTLQSVNAANFSYSSGVSLGWNMKRNIWLSVGYNISGFEDNDFSTAGYTAAGPYVRFRMKFDQDTAKNISQWLNL